MYTVDLYRRVRRAHFVEAVSIWQAARMFNLHRNTVNKMLEASVPLGYQRQQPPRRPKLDPYTPIIEQILQADQARPKKQRHTAKRIFERLKEEHGFSGQYTIVKDYVRQRRTSTREMFVPLVHPPGHGQADFGGAQVIINGVPGKAHYLVVDLPYSDATTSRPIQRRPLKPSVMATAGPSPSSEVCPRASSTTTPSWRPGRHRTRVYLATSIFLGARPAFLAYLSINRRRDGPNRQDLFCLRS